MYATGFNPHWFKSHKRDQLPHNGPRSVLNLQTMSVVHPHITTATLQNLHSSPVCKGTINTDRGNTVVTLNNASDYLANGLLSDQTIGLRL